jgi:hypothetical protein
MRDNSVKLQRLIEDLLDYQRACRGGVTRAAPGQLDALVRGLCARTSSRCAQGAGACPGPRQGDGGGRSGETALDPRQPAGQRRPFTRAAARSPLAHVAGVGAEAVSTCRFRPGVPMEERDAIFTFFRGRARASGRIEGTGLGLPSPSEDSSRRTAGASAWSRARTRSLSRVTPGRAGACWRRHEGSLAALVVCPRPCRLREACSRARSTPSSAKRLARRGRQWRSRRPAARQGAGGIRRQYRQIEPAAARNCSSCCRSRCVTMPVPRNSWSRS